MWAKAEFDHLDGSPVQQALVRHVKEQKEVDVEEPFYVCDLAHVTRKTQEWCTYMPHAAPFYAVKCNPDAVLVQHLASLGVNFDCASRAEMELVLKQGVRPSSIIFANPCKGRSCLRFAQKMGVETTTFDNAAELVKIAKTYPSARLVLRILADDETALCRLGAKFGATVLESFSLLQHAKDLRLNVVGVSFHVGSGAKDVNAFKLAIRDAHQVWTSAEELGFSMSILDIGGGFSQYTLSTMAPAINDFLDDYFGHIPCHIIAEPGRYFAEGAYTLACSILAQRDPSTAVNDGIPVKMLYLSDGVYGSFGNCVYEKAQYTPKMLCQGDEYLPERDRELVDQDLEHSIWGPTCDSADCINKGCTLNFNAETGDWLYFSDMGAYSSACVTNFNGFSTFRRVVYLGGSKRIDRKGSDSSFEDEGFSLH